MVTGNISLLDLLTAKRAGNKFEAQGYNKGRSEKARGTVIYFQWALWSPCTLPGSHNAVRIPAEEETRPESRTASGLSLDSSELINNHTPACSSSCSRTKLCKA